MDVALHDAFLELSSRCEENMEGVHLSDVLERFTDVLRSEGLAVEDTATFVAIDSAVRMTLKGKERKETHRT